MVDKGRSHLRFERTKHQNPRKTRRPPIFRPPSDPAHHGRDIREQVERLEAEPEKEPGFDPRLLLKLEVENPSPDLFVPIPGISLVGQEGKTLLLLFADAAGLAEFKRRLSQLEAGESPTRKEILYAVKSVEGWGPEDRLGESLGAHGAPTAYTTFDVELWPLELSYERQAMLAAFRDWCAEVRATILDTSTAKAWSSFGSHASPTFLGGC